MIETWLLIIIFTLAILYWLELLKNVKLEKERDIEYFEKKALEIKVKRLENDEYKSNLIKKIEEKNKQISLLNSKVQYRDKLLFKCKENGKVQI